MFRHHPPALTAAVWSAARGRQRSLRQSGTGNVAHPAQAEPSALLLVTSSLFRTCARYDRNDSPALMGRAVGHQRTRGVANGLRGRVFSTGTHSGPHHTQAHDGV